jgi:hypothetical protein
MVKKKKSKSKKKDFGNSISAIIKNISKKDKEMNGKIDKILNSVDNY